MIPESHIITLEALEIAVEALNDIILTAETSLHIPPQKTLYWLKDIRDNALLKIQRKQALGV